MNTTKIGIIGCGKIGSCVAKIANGFGMRVLLFDVVENPAAELYGSYTTLDELLQESELVTLHCPLNDKTFHLMSEQTLNQMKPGAMLVNTSRGGLVDTAGVIKQLKSGRLGGLAIDVYEEDLFLSFLPLSHTLERTAGYYLPIMSGSAVAYARSVLQLAEDLQNIQPTVLIAVPRIFERVFSRMVMAVRSSTRRSMSAPLASNFET